MMSQYSSFYSSIFTILQSYKCDSSSGHFDPQLCENAATFSCVLRKMFTLCTKTYKLCFYREVMCFSFSLAFGKQTSRLYRLFSSNTLQESEKAYLPKRSRCPQAGISRYLPAELRGARSLFGHYTCKSQLFDTVCSDVAFSIITRFTRESEHDWVAGCFAPCLEKHLLIILVAKFFRC